MPRFLPLFGLSVLICGLPGHSLAANPTPGSSTREQIRLDDFLWREVQNKEGETLGSVSDVLVQMPSGRIVFVAVVPAEFFERPTAVPPGAISKYLSLRYEMAARAPAPVSPPLIPPQAEARPSAARENAGFPPSPRAVDNYRQIV